MLPTETESVRAFELSICPVGRPGAENMALDAALLEEAACHGRAFLRLYRFDPPCLSFGRNEPAARRYDRAAIARLGLDVVRRPTGGRAVWHEHELTYAVAAPVGASGSLAERYHAIHRRLAAALRALGADAILARDRPIASPRDRRGPCFGTPVESEVLVAGRKVVGSAQLRQGRAFLQHGSILLDGSQRIVTEVSTARGAGTRETTLAAVLGRRVSFDEVALAVSEAFGCPAAAQQATALPPAHPPARLTAAFRDPSWTWRR